VSQLRIGSLFSGAGLLDLAIEEVPIEEVVREIFSQTQRDRPASRLDESRAVA